MAKYVEITVAARLKDGHEEVGHEAVFVTKEVVESVAAKLRDLGLEPESHRKITTRREESAPRKKKVELVAAE